MATKICRERINSAADTSAWKNIFFMKKLMSKAMMKIEKKNVSCNKQRQKNLSPFFIPCRLRLLVLADDKTNREFSILGKQQTYDWKNLSLWYIYANDFPAVSISPTKKKIFLYLSSLKFEIKIQKHRSLLDGLDLRGKTNIIQVFFYKPKNTKEMNIKKNSNSKCE